MFSRKYIRLINFLYFGFLFSKFDCKVDNAERYFAVETTENDEVTLSYPLFTNKLVFGIQLYGSSYCPKIVFSNRAQNSSVSPNLSVYFCASTCILKSASTELVRKPMPDVLLADKYKGFKILFDQTKGIITVSQRNEEKSILEYTYASRLEFKEYFISHFAVGGNGRWIIEETTEQLVAENLNENYASSTFFPITRNRIIFGIKFSAKIVTHCPRIEFHDRPVKSDQHYLSFFFCKSSYGVTDGASILREVPGELVNNMWNSGYWISLNQRSNKLSIGKTFNSTPFFHYSYANRFKDTFFTHFSFVGLVKLTLLTSSYD